MHNEENCPYCNTSEDCPHLLLLVDVTFRSAEGGILLSEFNEKWQDIFEEKCERIDFDEAWEFDKLLEVLDKMSDREITREFEGGPGQSSTYQAFYCANEKVVKKILTFFTSSNK